MYTNIYLFPSGDSFEFFVTGLSRPIVGRQSANSRPTSNKKNIPLKFSRMLGDDRPIYFSSDDHLQTGDRLSRLSAVDQMMIGQSMAFISHTPYFHSVFMYTYFDKSPLISLNVFFLWQKAT